MSQSPPTPGSGFRPPKPDLRLLWLIEKGRKPQVSGYEDPLTVACGSCGEANLVRTHEGLLPVCVGCYCPRCGFWWAANTGTTLEESFAAYDDWISSLEATYDAENPEDSRLQEIDLELTTHAGLNP